MPDANSPALLLSRTIDGIEVIAVYANGRVVLRHRREDGILAVHIQDVPVVAQIVSDKAHLEWEVSIIEMPPSIAPFFTPSSLIGLRRVSANKNWDFLFTRVPCSPDQLEAIFNKSTRFALLINSNELTCHRERYDAYQKGKPSHPSSEPEL
jgi:hypothetical protein